VSEDGKDDWTGVIELWIYWYAWFISRRSTLSMFAGPPITGHKATEVRAMLQCGRPVDDRFSISVMAAL
jgi:hypothetical protein